MTDRLVSVGDDFILPSSVKAADGNLPATSPATVIVSTGNETRPTTRDGAIVIWIGGTTSPANAIINDVHVKDVIA